MRIFNDISPIIYGLDGKVKEVIKDLWVSEASPVIFFPIIPRTHPGSVSELEDAPSESPEYAVAVFREVLRSRDVYGYSIYAHTEYIIPEGYPDPLPTILSLRTKNAIY